VRDCIESTYEGKGEEKIVKERGREEGGKDEEKTWGMALERARRSLRKR
jgi:hypothetical protein